MSGRVGTRATSAHASVDAPGRREGDASSVKKEKKGGKIRTPSQEGEKTDQLWSG